MRILVTGGAGFVGSTLCKLLLNLDHTVHVMDNLSTNAVNKVPGALLIAGDIRDLHAVNLAIANCDCVIHLAAIPGVEACQKNPNSATLVNVIGTMNVLRAATDQGIRRFILASSVGAVLGVQNQPAHEEQTPSPLTVYGRTKWEAENIGLHTFNKIPVTVLRFTNIYGENCRLKSSIVAKLLRNGADSAFMVYGDGCQTRDMVYVGDVARAIVLAAEKAPPGVFHIGSGKRVSLLDLIGIVRDVTRKPIPLEFTDPREGDVRDNYSSIRKAREVLGYEPRVALEDGVHLTWEWMQTGREDFHRET